MKREQPIKPRNVIGPTMRRLRLAAKPEITQEDICGRVAKYGIVLTRPQIGKIEAGTRPVFDYEAVAFSRALKVPLESLFDGTAKY